jgi:hypothetical protein
MWVQNLIAFSSHYPSIVNFINVIAAVIGVLIIIYTGMLAYKQSTNRLQNNSAFGIGKIIILLFIGSFLITYGYTMMLVGNSVFAYGAAFTITDYASTADLVLADSGNAVKILQDFTILSSRVIAIFVGFWGILNIFHGVKPDGKSELVTAGITRLFVSVILAKPKEFFDLFGLGSAFFS